MEIHEWKSTKVILYIKKEERSDLNNYRPIFIIPMAGLQCHAVKNKNRNHSIN